MSRAIDAACRSVARRVARARARPTIHPSRGRPRGRSFRMSVRFITDRRGVVLTAGSRMSGVVTACESGVFRWMGYF